VSSGQQAIYPRNGGRFFCDLNSWLQPTRRFKAAPNNPSNSGPDPASARVWAIEQTQSTLARILKFKSSVFSGCASLAQLDGVTLPRSSSRALRNVFRWLMRAIVAQVAKAAKAAFLALSKPAPYGLSSVMDALIALRDVLSLIRTAARDSLAQPLAASPARLSAGLR